MLETPSVQNGGFWLVDNVFQTLAGNTRGTAVCSTNSKTALARLGCLRLEVKPGWRVFRRDRRDWLADAGTGKIDGQTTLEAKEISGAVWKSSFGPNERHLRIIAP